MIRSTANRLHAEFRLDEDAADGTVAGNLKDRHPDLRNFRLTPDSETLPFAVDPASGQIVVSDQTGIDFEHRTLHSFSVHADRNLSREDRFLQQFAGSLLEEGLPADRVNQLLISTETIRVRIRLQNVPEVSPVPALVAEIKTGESQDTTAVTAAIDEAAEPSSAGSDSATLPDLESHLTDPVEIPVITSESVPVSETSEIETPQPEIGNLPESQHESENVSGDEGKGNPIEQLVVTPSVIEIPEIESVDETDPGDTAVVAMPVTSEAPVAKPSVRNSGALAIMISITGLALFSICFKARRARRRSKTDTETDDKCADFTPPAESSELAEETPEATVQPQHPEWSEEIARRDARIHESQAMIEHLRREIDERDSRIVDLKEKLEAVILRLEDRSSRQKAEPDDRDTDEHRVLQSIDDISPDLWFDTPDSGSTDDEPFMDSDPRGSLMRARGELQRTFDRLADEPSHRPAGFRTGEFLGKADSPETNDRSLRGSSGDSLIAGMTLSQSCVAIAEPDTTLDERTEQYHSAEETDSSEESHLDSVAQYLNNLLSRSGKGTAGKGSQVDHRNSTARTPGHEDKRTSKSNQPVKSYIETYLSEHGGQLQQDLLELQQLQTAPVSNANPPAPVVRAPVDVRTIREHMNSFREVASQSVDNALASYSWRQARDKLAWRSILLLTLVVITIVIVVTNTARIIRFESLNWLMTTIVLLTMAELFLRVKSIRRQQNLRQRSASEGKRQPLSRDAEVADHGEDATAAR